MLPFLPLIGTALSGAMSLFGQNQTNQANSANAADRYQVASADMTKAGLNPASMFGGGSAAQMPQIQSSMQGPANAAGNIMQALSTAKQMEQMDASIANIKAGVANTEANTANTRVDTLNKGKQGGLINAQTATEAAKPALIGAQTFTEKGRGYVAQRQGDIADQDLYGAKNRAVTSRNQMDMNPTFRKVLDQSGFAGRAASDIVSPIGSVLSSAKSVKSLVGGLFRDNSEGMSAIPQAN